MTRTNIEWVAQLFFDRGIMGLRPTQGDEKRLSFSNYSPGKRRYPFVISTEAKWRDVVTVPLTSFSVHSPSPLSSRPKRSAVERSLYGNSFLEMFLLIGDIPKEVRPKIASFLFKFDLSLAVRLYACEGLGY
jgi:hypothetical protein